MTTPDFPDWQLPVSLVDRAVQVTGSPYVLHDGQAVGNIDTARYSSLGLAILLPTPASFQRYLIDLEWKESGVFVDSDSLSFHSVFSYALGGITTLYWHLPVRGSLVNVNVHGSNASNMTVTVIASTRELTGGRQTVTNDAIGRNLMDTDFGVIAAGATSSTLALPPVARAVRMRNVNRISTVVTALLGVHAAGGVITASRFDTFPGDSVANTGEEITAVNTGLEVSVTNNDAAGHSTQVQFWDVS